MTQFDWFSQARIHETSGDLKAALEAYESALKIDPKFAKAWYYKAKLHLRMGQKKEAKESANKALEFEPKWEKHVEKLLAGI